MQDAAAARGLAVLCASADGDPERERSLVEAFAARGADGLILVPSGADQSYLAAEVASGTAVVCVARAPRRLDVDAVVATDATGAASGVGIAAHGHTRIAFLGEGHGGEGLAGYRAGLEAAGLVLDPALVVADLADAALADAAVGTLFRTADPPTALFTARDAVTVAALRRPAPARAAAARRGGRVRRLRHRGPALPGITVVAQDPAGIGRRAAYLLFARMAGEAGPPATHHVRRC